jgi:hypothetical protein
MENSALAFYLRAFTGSPQRLVWFLLVAWMSGMFFCLLMGAPLNLGTSFSVLAGNLVLIVLALVLKRWRFGCWL